MSPFGCARENEVTEHLRQGYWPDACPAELRAHVETCRTCADLVLVAALLNQERKQAVPMARLEAPGALWWRAQLRRRNAAIETMARPIFGAQVFALVMAVLVAAAILAWQAGNWGEWISELPHTLHLDALLGSGGMLLILAPVLGMIALLSGVVVYFVSEKQ